MPILDPLIQYKLISKESQTRDSKKPPTSYFFEKLLELASQEYISFASLESSLACIKFKKDLAQSIEFINRVFNIQFTENDINVPNLYDNLYKLINKDSINREITGEYFQIRSLNSIFNFFQPDVLMNNYHSWFLSDTPIAVLSLKFPGMSPDAVDFIQLEADLLASLGLTLILVINYPYTLDVKDNDYLIKILQEIPFAEIHFNYDYDICSSNLLGLLSQIYEYINDFDRYLYIYKQYINDSKNDDIVYTGYIKNIYKNLKKKTTTKIIRFGNSIQSSFKKYNIEKKQDFSFSYCINSDTINYIKITLCDVPIYDTDDEKQYIISTEFSNINNTHYIAFIMPEDFLYYHKNMVKILLYENDKYIEKYVNFNDLHYVNPHLYVSHPIDLARVKIDEIKVMDRIISRANDKYELKQDDDFKKQFFFSLIKEKKIINLLQYVLYAYKMYRKDFQFLKSQVFVALRAVNFCVLQHENHDNKGFVYQVSTGEGKSSIVVLIAAVLALFKKNVHIVTSNIVLANRDYCEAYDFFRFLGLKTAVLIHDNEKPNFEEEKDPVCPKNYPYEFYNDEIFKNSMNMNFDICGILSNKCKADIIFSTIVNFESLYLYMNEKVPGKIDEYYKKSSLVIDEADLILIDELPNGTILSRPMKSNARHVLSYVYNTKTENDKVTAEEIYNHIKKEWPECSDISIKSVEDMFEEIKIVNTDKEFVKGTKYEIVPIPVKKGVKYAKTKKEIIPFDYDHTGILERNKEFCGFIPQFISLKEQNQCKNDEEIIFKEISMNYLYISHPIYVNLYNSVCGLTGTIGNQYDKEILAKHYKLSTLKVPRENPNQRYEFPMILCDTIEERNHRIVEEIMQFHAKGWPVLAIFFSPSEIEEIQKLIESHELFNKEKDEIGIYNGMNDKIKPDVKAGQEGAISLGTNVCGRGTHIEVGKKPLHVIVSFYSSNKRSMNQAFGRTARQKNFGTVRTICLLTQYFAEKKVFNDEEIKKNLYMLSTVNLLQNEFVDHFRLKKREWIFDGHIGNQKISNEHINTLRSTRINVNRIDAFDFSFPVGMNIDTFLDIQAQKIFSIYNCPNSKYTWRLFQQYAREMLLESWSLLLNRLEKLYNQLEKEKKVELYQSMAKNLYDDLINKLKLYFPEDKQYFNIVDSFMWIFSLVNEKYKRPVLKYYESIMPNDENDEERNTIGKTKLSRISFGFRPFTLKYRSGSRILSILNQNQICRYIEDPELKYLKAGSIASITDRVDAIFEKILNLVSNFLGNHLMFKLFLRRTLAGCEFGLCYEFDEINDDDYFKFVKNILFDKDPLFVFSIYVKSVIPFLAGILILLLLYLVNIIRQLAAYGNVFTASGKIVKKVAIEVAKCIAEQIIDNLEDTAVGKLTGYLYNVLKKQIERIKFIKPKHYHLMSMIASILAEKAPDPGDKLYEKLSSKFRFNRNSIKGKVVDRTAQHLFKIGFLLILCAAAYMMSFHANKSLKFSRTEVANEFTESKDENKIDTYIENNNKILDSEIPRLNK